MQGGWMHGQPDKQDSSHKTICYPYGSESQNIKYCVSVLFSMLLNLWGTFVSHQEQWVLLQMVHKVFFIISWRVTEEGTLKLNWQHSLTNTSLLCSLVLTEWCRSGVSTWFSFSWHGADSEMTCSSLAEMLTQTPHVGKLSSVQGQSCWQNPLLEFCEAFSRTCGLSSSVCFHYLLLAHHQSSGPPLLEEHPLGLTQ